MNFTSSDLSVLRRTTPRRLGSRAHNTKIGYATLQQNPISPWSMSEDFARKQYTILQSDRPRANPRDMTRLQRRYCSTTIGDARLQYCYSTVTVTITMSNHRRWGQWRWRCPIQWQCHRRTTHSLHRRHGQGDAAKTILGWNRGWSRPNGSGACIGKKELPWEICTFHLRLNNVSEGLEGLMSTSFSINVSRSTFLDQRFSINLPWRWHNYVKKRTNTFNLKSARRRPPSINLWLLVHWCLLAVENE